MLQISIILVYSKAVNKPARLTIFNIEKNAKLILLYHIVFYDNVSSIAGGMFVLYLNSIRHKLLLKIQSLT